MKKQYVPKRKPNPGPTPMERRMMNTPAKPQTEIEWLMMPHAYGKPRSEQVLDLVAECVDRLDERSRECIEAIHFERRSYAVLGERLGCSKPHAWRLTRRAEEELRDILLDHADIRERFT